MISFFVPIVHSKYFTIDFAMKMYQKILIIKYVILICNIILLFGLFFLLINTDYLANLIFILPIIYILSFLLIVYYRKIRKKMPDWVYKIDNNQGVLLNENDISIIKNENNILSLKKEDIDKIFISNNYYKGCPSGQNWFNVFPISNGVSRLRIFLKNGEQHDYMYFIENEFEYLKFKNRLDLLTEHYSIEVKSLYYHL